MILNRYNCQAVISNSRKAKNLMEPGQENTMDDVLSLLFLLEEVMASCIIIMQSDTTQTIIESFSPNAAE